MPSTLDALEAGAREIDRQVDERVERCIAARNEPVALRREVDALAPLPGQGAEFAFCLFSLELAQLGEAQAREGFTQHAGVLLEAYRSPELVQYLLGAHPALQARWERFLPLLAEFDGARQGLDASAASDARPPTTPMLVPMPPRRSPEPITVESSPDDAADSAIGICFRSRGSVEALEASMEALAAHPGDRVQFALCLFNLDLARMGVAGAKREFALRTGLLLEAFQAPPLAARLIGGSAGLRGLWEDVQPYLEEFSEAVGAEEPSEEEFAILDAMTVDEGEPVGELDVVDVSGPIDLDEGAPLDVVFEPAPEPARPPSRPPPPPNLTPLPGKLAAFRAAGRTSGVTRKPPLPPPPPPPTGEHPTPETEAFWAHTEKALSLLPDESGMLLGKQAFAMGTREERHRLESLVTELITGFPTSPPARALACLTQLYLAVQVKEKTLFGKSNEKRKVALREALSLLTTDSLAAGQAAVLFENDGPQTIEGLARGLAIVQAFLGFCLRERLDPTVPAAVDRFID